MEGLLAIALAGILFLSGLALFFTASSTSSESMRREQALWQAEEGLQALQTMAFENLFLTETGSLTFSTNQWTLMGNGPQSLSGGFSRTVKVQTVERNPDCDMVASGGISDPDGYFLESQVTWTDAKGNAQDITLRILRTHWQNPQGSCFPADCSQLDWDVLTASWFGGKQLRNIYITNNTGEEKEIESMTLTWNNSATIQQVFFNNEKFWSSSGPGTPSGEQVSGVVLSGEDGDIANGETVEMHKTQFSNNMEGTEITITYACTDGSSITFGPFTPSY